MNVVYHICGVNTKSANDFRKCFAPNICKGRKQNMNKRITGHFLAIITIVIWSTTFISTKVLLRTFSPVEILVLRFIIGYITLFAVNPHFLRTAGFKQEMMYALAGLTGVGLYYMLENTGLEYTMASNAGVIIAAAPFFTAVLAHLINKRENRFKWNFFVGFVIAFAGIAIISFNGARFELKPIGDLMIFGAALCWAVYCNVLKKISTFGHSLLLGTRRIFAWGLLFFVICIPFMDFKITVSELIMPANIGNLLFLGVGACAGCFIMWNYASDIIGPVSANFYIYLTPVVTIAASALLLEEPITGLLIIGTVLTLAGLVVSEWTGLKKKMRNNSNPAESSFYEIRQEEVRVNPDSGYPGISTPEDLYRALAHVWCADTCAPRMRQDWSSSNMTLGQCSITAFLAQDIFGGEVYGVPLGDGNYHCYNVVGNSVFDLTSGQFDILPEYGIRNIKAADGSEKAEISDSRQLREVHFAKTEKKARYEKLKTGLEAYLANVKTNNVM